MCGCLLKINGEAQILSLPKPFLLTYSSHPTQQTKSSIIHWQHQYLLLQQDVPKQKHPFLLRPVLRHWVLWILDEKQKTTKG